MNSAAAFLSVTLARWLCHRQLPLVLQLGLGDLTQSIPVLINWTIALLLGKLLVLAEQSLFKLVICLWICADSLGKVGELLSLDCCLYF